MCCRPPPHDAWAGGSFAAITRGLLRPGCGRLAARLAGPTYSRMACQQRQRRDNVRPTQPLERHCREKLAQHAIKRQLWAFLSSQGEHFRTRTHIAHAGRTFSRTGHSHVPTMKPMTPLQPLMQASMKPPAPLLAPKQRPLKPATPLQPKNAPKTPISRPQRRWRFQPHAHTSEQRRHRFHARDFRCRWAAAGPEPNKSRT